MHYFSHLPDALFAKRPTALTNMSPREHIAYGLGALLYMPATREDISTLITTQKFAYLRTLAICLEDAIADNEVEAAERSLLTHLAALPADGDLPFIFIRLRSPEQFVRLAPVLRAYAAVITGFIFPKFSTANAGAYFTTLATLNQGLVRPLYAMPILESTHVLYKEQRMAELLALKTCIDGYADWVLNIRIGATDLCGLYGLRRDARTPIYDIGLVRELITDTLNVFMRAPQTYVVSGPVWEYFDEASRAGLVREVQLDRANGIVGKTVIHPSHLAIVQALQAVTLEEYQDASAILAHSTTTNGVFSSEFRNKMNETKPHLRWAQTIAVRALVYGVLAHGKTYEDLCAPL